ncbi:hypothetical protein D3C79_640990 [compost metagenome]
MLEHFLQLKLQGAVDRALLGNMGAHLRVELGVDLVGRDHVEQLLGRLEAGLGGSDGLLGPEGHFIFGWPWAPGTPHDAAPAKERHHAVLPADVARWLVGGAGREGPGEGFGKATEGFLVGDRQVLEVLGEEERPAFDHQDPRLGVAAQDPLGEGQGAEAGTDNDEVELLLFADLFPGGLGEKEHMVQHLLCVGCLWAGGGVAMTEIGRTGDCAHCCLQSLLAEGLSSLYRSCIPRTRGCAGALLTLAEQSGISRSLGRGGKGHAVQPDGPASDFRMAEKIDSIRP